MPSKSNADDKIRVMFVCLGNICRSPLAHGLFRNLVEEAGLADRFEIESSGTGAWHVGEQPDARMQQTARRNGVPLDDLRARQVCAEDFHRFDRILAMDRANLADLRRLAPARGGAELSLMLSHGSRGGGEVPDPYYGGAEGFEHVLDLLEDACAGLLDRLARETDGSAP